MSRALGMLQAARLAGHKPASVWVVIGDGKEPKWWRFDDWAPEIRIGNNPESARLDFRPLIGCNVLLLADSKTSVLTQITRRLQQLVERLTVFILDQMPGVIGHEWTRGAGWREVARG